MKPFHLLTVGLALLVVSGCSQDSDFQFHPEDRIVFVGNALADRMQHDGWLESWLQAAHPEHELVVRNLAVSGDRLDHQPRSCGGRGDLPDVIYECSDHQFWHPDTLLAALEPTVVFGFFGYNESFDDDPERFREQLLGWIEKMRRIEGGRAGGEGGSGSVSGGGSDELSAAFDDPATGSDELSAAFDDPATGLNPTGSDPSGSEQTGADQTGAEQSGSDQTGADQTGSEQPGSQGAATPPRLVLVSPIAHENLQSRNVPDGVESNRRLEAYTEVMAEVAREQNIPFIDLFTESQRLYARSSEPLTINGVHLHSDGNRQIAEVIVEQLLGSVPPADGERLESIREAVLDKNWHGYQRYRATSGNDIWGSRKDWHDNYRPLQHELRMLDVMTANRDRVIWNWARLDGRDPEGQLPAGVLTADDSNVPAPLQADEEMVAPYSSEFRPGSATPHEEVTYLGGEEAIEEMVLAEGLSVNLFASEEMFPELINPRQMQVDSQGRLWVSVWPTYPKWEPGEPMNDGILILEDSDGDGVADTSIRFATIPNPTGFEFWNGGILVASAPDLWYLKDTDGDGRADVKIQLLGNFDDAMDTHHTANSFVYGPDGYLYFSRGIFHMSNVETPWSEPVESAVPAVFRFNPRTHHFEKFVEVSPNPHGISFDRWGRQYATDATSGRSWQLGLNRESGEYEARQLLDQTVRPVTGSSVLSSGHLPEQFQDNFLISNVISFRGIKRYRLVEGEEGVWGDELEDLLYSRDPNFRPSDSVVGADGALYVSDWHNPHIAHSIPNMRSELRDHTHGRIYRITADDRPLQEPVAIHGEATGMLLSLLNHPVDGVRHRVRIELSGRDTDEVLAAMGERLNSLDPEERGHLMLEYLWLHQQHNVENRELLELLLNASDSRIREAAERVRNDWTVIPPGERFVVAETGGVAEGGSAGREGVGSDEIAGAGSGDAAPYSSDTRSAGSGSIGAEGSGSAKLEGSAAVGSRGSAETGSAEGVAEEGSVGISGVGSAKREETSARLAEMESGIELDLTELGVAELEIRAIPHRLLYDVTKFTVRRGQQVRLTFINPDYMPHNLLIVQPGSADEVAEEAIRLDAEGFAMQFIPDSPNVLVSSSLLNVDEQELIEFVAPDKPGAYEFICSFPGHADTMRGIMVVR